MGGMALSNREQRLLSVATWQDKNTNAASSVTTYYRIVSGCFHPPTVSCIDDLSAVCLRAPNARNAPSQTQMRSKPDNKVEQSGVDRRRRRRRHPVVRLRQIDDHRRPLHRCLPPSRWRAKHVTEVNDITCNYDRLISGSEGSRSTHSVGAQNRSHSRASSCNIA